MIGKLYAKWNSQGRYQLLRLFSVSLVTIKRYIKIRSDATLYDPKYNEYFEKRWERVKLQPFI